MAEENVKEEPVVKEEENKPQENDYNKESLLKDLYSERDRRKTLQAENEKLKATANTINEAKENQAATQHKYDRLESFLLALDKDISAALDSRSFSKQLFETDTPIKDLVDTWNKQHPSQTAKALNATPAKEKEQENTISDLLHAAIAKAR